MAISLSKEGSIPWDYKTDSPLRGWISPKYCIPFGDLVKEWEKDPVKFIELKKARERVDDGDRH